MPTVRQRDPMRNFKFSVQIINPDLHNVLTNMGFTNVSGMSMNTEMVGYREGGWNTNLHKLPGQTDFAPLTLVQGVLAEGETASGMWDLAKTMFAVNWGQGTLPFTAGSGSFKDFRYTTLVRILDHPVTKVSGDPSAQASWDKTARLAIKFYDCWTGSVALNDLDASSNNVLIQQMTMHHEGFDILRPGDPGWPG